MRCVLLVPLVTSVLACTEKPPPMPPKRPNNELIVGTFNRKPPTGTTAIRFDAGGSVSLAAKAEELDGKTTASGTYTLQGDQLTLTYTRGDVCPADVTGTYKVVISKLGIRFTKIDDACERRSKMDAETWYRVGNVAPPPKPIK